MIYAPAYPVQGTTVSPGPPHSYAFTESSAIVMVSHSGTSSIGASLYSIGGTGTGTVYAYGCNDQDMRASRKIITVSVYNPNSAPVFTAPDFVTDEDVASPWTAVSISDDAGNTHTSSITAQPSIGNVSVAGTSLRFVPAANVTGTATYTARVCDNHGACTQSTGSITVNPVNDRPSLAAPDITTPEDVPSAWFPVSITDSDPGDIHIIKVVTQPPLGRIELDQAAMSVRLVPGVNLHGTATFTIEACDTAGACAQSTATAVVDPVNDPPVLVVPDLHTDEDKPGPYLVVSIVDPDVGDTHTQGVIVQPSLGTVEVLNDTVRIVPAANRTGNDLYVGRVCDRAGACAEATGTVTVNPVNDPPDFALPDLVVDEDATLLPSVLFDITDPDGDVAFDVLVVAEPVFSRVIG